MGTLKIIIILYLFATWIIQPIYAEAASGTIVNELSDRSGHTLSYSLSGASSTTKEEVQHNVSIKGTVIAGEEVTLNISGSSLSWSGHDSNEFISAQISAALTSQGGRSGTAKDSKDIQLSAGGSGSVSVSIRVPKDATRVTGNGRVSTNWRNVNGSFSNTLRVRLDLRVIQDETIVVENVTQQEEVVVEDESTINDAETILPGLGAKDALSGPEDISQALVGILVPGIISVLIGILGGGGLPPTFGGFAVSVPSGPNLPDNTDGIYDFNDGRTYREGQQYTFDDGVTYEVVNGEFVARRTLKDGERYINPDGNKKIFIGGQSWYEEDWQRQAASNKEGLEAFREDASDALEQRRQEAAQAAQLVEMRKQQAYEDAQRLEQLAQRIQSGNHPLSESRHKESYISELMENSKQLRKTGDFDHLDKQIIERLMDRMYPEMERHQKEVLTELVRAERSARNWDRATRSAEFIQKVADKGVDIIANATQPFGGEKYRMGYLALRGLAGGISEGVVTGEYQRSLFEHLSEAGADYAESRLSGKTEKIFGVAREMTTQGYQAYMSGENVLDGILDGALQGVQGLAVDFVIDSAVESLGDYIKPETGMLEFWEKNPKDMTDLFNIKLENSLQHLVVGEIDDWISDIHSDLLNRGVRGVTSIAINDIGEYLVDEHKQTIINGILKNINQ